MEKQRRTAFMSMLAWAWHRSPLAPDGALGFVPLPPTYWIYLCLILVDYAVLTRLMKTWCTRRFELS